MCDENLYKRDVLQKYQERVKSKYKDTVTGLDLNDFADYYYETNLRGQDSLITYQILHLSDLAIDLRYVNGAETKCRDFRCCHATARDETSTPKNPAGPYGNKGCDQPLDGTRVLLTRLKEQILADYGEVNMIVVTGNVVTNQPG